MADLETRLAAWMRAECDGDVGALDGLLYPQFRGIGPFGFLLDREQWRQRFDGGLTYAAFEFTTDTAPLVIGDSILAVGTQTQSGTYQGRPVDGAFRVSLVLTGADLLLAAVHLSLRHPPAAAAVR